MSADVDVDGATHRTAICDVIEGEATVAQVVTDVAKRCDCPEWVVVDQIDTLEDSGLLYRHGEGREAEVCLP